MTAPPRRWKEDIARVAYDDCEINVDQRHPGALRDKARSPEMVDASVMLKTRTGVELHVRPVRVTDEPLLAEFFSHVTKEDLSFRYLVGIGHINPERIAELAEVDHVRVENYLAFGKSGTPLIATAMLACDADFERAEVAITIREDFKDHGIGWELLSYLSKVAQAKGVKVLESLERRENHAAIELEKHMGFSAEPDPDDSTLLIVRKELTENAVVS
jgi:GNAT superfamily N-acetyltransferase